MNTPIEKLDDFLKLYHPQYQISDVVLSPAKRYLQTTKPGTCNHSLCRGGFYHTIDIHGAGYPERDEEGRYISPYRLWYELHRFIPKESEIKHDD